MITSLKWWGFISRKIWKTEDNTTLGEDTVFINKATNPVLGSELISPNIFEDQVKRESITAIFSAGGWTINDWGLETVVGLVPFAIAPVGIVSSLIDGKAYRLKLTGNFKTGSLTAFLGQGNFLAETGIELDENKEAVQNYSKGDGSLVLLIAASEDFQGTITGISLKPIF